MKSAFIRFTRCVVAALCFSSAASHAVSLSPVLVELSPARRVAAVTIANPGDGTVSFQADALAWSQPDGQDRYEETDDLLVVPPIADIPPGGSQIFRVTSRSQPDGRERAYRLIFDDITVLAEPASDKVALNIRVSHDLPVFIAPGNGQQARPRLAPCEGVATTPPDRGCVRIVNEGERYLVMKSLTLAGPGWRKEISASARVLAGAWREWRFDLPRQPGGPLHVQADTSAGPVTLDLAIPAR